MPYLLQMMWMKSDQRTEISAMFTLWSKNQSYCKRSFLGHVNVTSLQHFLKEIVCAVRKETLTNCNKNSAICTNKRMVHKNLNTGELVSNEHWLSSEYLIIWKDTRWSLILQLAPLHSALQIRNGYEGNSWDNILRCHVNRSWTTFISTQKL